MREELWKELKEEHMALPIETNNGEVGKRCKALRMTKPRAEANLYAHNSACEPAGLACRK